MTKHLSKESHILKCLAQSMILRAMTTSSCFIVPHFTIFCSWYWYTRRSCPCWCSHCFSAPSFWSFVIWLYDPTGRKYSRWWFSTLTVCDSYSWDWPAISLQNPLSISASSVLPDSPPYMTRAELESHADTCCFGAECIDITQHEEFVSNCCAIWSILGQVV